MGRGQLRDTAWPSLNGNDVTNSDSQSYPDYQREQLAESKIITRRAITPLTASLSLYFIIFVWKDTQNLPG